MNFTTGEFVTAQKDFFFSGDTKRTPDFKKGEKYLVLGVGVSSVAVQTKEGTTGGYYYIDLFTHVAEDIFGGDLNKDYDYAMGVV